MTAAMATHPYSSRITQPGSASHAHVTERRCRDIRGIMLTVQMMISRVEADVRNGKSQRRYQGNTTVAHKSDAAIGHTNTFGDHSTAMALSQAAVATRMYQVSRSGRGRD